VPYVISQRWREYSDKRSGRVHLGVVEGEIGDPVKRDRRLARTGRSANREKARRGARNQFELFGVDQARDFWQVLVGTARVAWNPELRRVVVGFAGAQRARFAAGKRGFLAFVANPFATSCRIGKEDALGALDPIQGGFPDVDGSTSENHSAVDSIAEGLFVFFALLVAVENLRNWSISPIHDA